MQAAATKPPKGSKGLPPSIAERKDKGGKFQARVYADRYGTGVKAQHIIPGFFETVEHATSAQAKAEQLLVSDGPLAVWPQDADGRKERNKRNQVRVPLCVATRPSSQL